LDGNDDVNMVAGQIESQVSHITDYDGWLYILVGQGHAVSPGDGKNYTYDLRCYALKN
jgi:hypothetical protein